MATTPEERLAAMGLELPTPASPVANYVSYVQTGNLLYLAGQVSRTPDGEYMLGKLGDTMSVEDGYKAARSAALFTIATMKEAIGDLGRMARFVRLFCMVNCTPNFGDQPSVMDGASDLFVDVFGDKGRHARCAVGHVSLPGGCAIEMEAIVEVGG
jgi:enamine deaminase RidA (YjgF/YER057c/UK114 family)